MQQTQITCYNQPLAMGKTRASRNKKKGAVTQKPQCQTFRQTMTNSRNEDQAPARKRPQTLPSANFDETPLELTPRALTSDNIPSIVAAVIQAMHSSHHHTADEEQMTNDYLSAICRMHVLAGLYEYFSKQLTPRVH